MKNYDAVSILLVILIGSSLLVPAYAQTQTPRFAFLVNQDSFVTGDILVVYGKTFANDTLIVRVFDPAGKAVKIDTVRADSTGAFSAQILMWPEPSRNFVYGRYAVEFTSNTLTSIKENRIVTFSDTPTGGFTRPPSSLLAVKLDSPAQVSPKKPFRIFVQVTFDGALVDIQNPEELKTLLGSSHVHAGNSTTVLNLAGKFTKLHEGLYYADVQLPEEGTYIIHAIAFYRGFLAHDSKVITSGTSIEDVQQSINNLRAELDNTTHELNSTRADITKSVEDASDSIKQDLKQSQETVREIGQASGQINSIIIPILALIAIVIALQISLFARIRASFK